MSPARRAATSAHPTRSEMSTVIQTDEQPGTTARATPHRPHRAHVPPRALHRRVPDQPVDEPGEPDRHRASRCSSGRRCTTRTSASATTCSSSTRSTACPTWSTPRTAASCIDNIAYGAKFTHPERQPEGPAYMDWFARSGFDVREPEEVNEGEGDFLLVGDTILAGTGFRSDSPLARGARAHLRPRGRDAAARRTRASTTSTPPSPCSTPTPGQEHIAYLPSAFDAAVPRRAAASATPTRSS